MASLIASIARAAQLTFSKGVLDESFPENFARLKDLINQVTSKDVSLSQDVVLRKTGRRSYFGRCAPVTYMDVFENEVYSIGIFIIHPGCRIPLHDHPDMHGIIKVLHGRLRIRSLTILGKEYLSKAPKAVRSTRGLIATLQHQDTVISTADEPCMLYPSEGNLHEIISVDGPAAFLDVLAPPYREEERDCHYYESVAEALLEVPDGRQERVNWLKSVLSSNEFWCDSAKYNGPSIILK